MSELGTLHHFPRAQADRAADADALRSETPLDVPAAAPDLAAFSGWQSLRLGAELAVRSRWMFMAGLLGVSLLSLPGLLGVREWTQQSAHAMVGLLVFTYGIARGVDGRSRERAFWAGLGAAPASMELGVVLVDLLFMGLLGGIGLLLGPQDPVFLALGVGAALVSYGFGSATRSAARSEAGRFGLVVAMLLVVAVNAGVAFGFSYGHVAIGVAMQLGIVAALGLVSRVLLSARAPEAAAGRGRRRWGWLGVALAGLLAVPLQFLQGMPEGTGQYPYDHGLLVPGQDPLAGQQVWRTTPDGGRERLGVRGRIAVEERGPHGAYVVRRTPLPAMVEILLSTETAAEAERLMVGGRASRLGLITADGGYVECAGPLFDGRAVVDDDGMGATHTLDGGGAWRIDGQGCRLLPDGETP